MDTTTEQPNIVVVDNDRDSLLLLVNLLETAGYQVQPLRDWKTALAAIYADPPDMLLLDVEIPGINIYEVCRHLKADAVTQESLILLISASDSWTSRVNAFSAGVTDYLTKPFVQEEILGRIRAHLSARAQSRRERLAAA